MAGFTSSDQIVTALTAGQTWRADWTKNFNPTTAAVANEWHTLFRGGGNPPADAIFNTGTNLLFQPVYDTTTSASSILHGGNVGSTYYKYILNASAVCAAAGVVPATLALIDVVGFYRVTSVTTTTAQSTTNTLMNFATVTCGTNNILTMTSTGSNIAMNIFPYTRVQFTTTGTLPTGLSTSTDYYIIRLSDSTVSVGSSYANAVAGTAVSITAGTGSGTHTMQTLLPRYTSGAGLNAFFFNSNSTALGAATPNLSLGYTNSAQTGSRATPAVLPVGKTAASNSLIIHTGATAAGKYNYATPRQAGDSGIAKIDTIQNATSYVSGEYSVALYKEILRIPVNVLGQAANINFLNEMPSLPRVYDGAALYWVVGSSTTTPANSTFSGHIDFIWN